MNSPDGRRSLGAEKVHLESIHPEVHFPMPPDLTVIIDDTTPPQFEISSPLPLPVTSVPYQISVPKGDVAGVSSVKISGRNSDVDSGSPEDVWEGGGVWVEPTTGQVHDIVSDDANDAAAGTGAQTVRVSGLVAGIEATENISMNGTTPVTTVNSYDIIHELKVIAAGTLGANVGTITATAQTDATLQIQINPLNNRSLQAIYKVPNDKTAYMSNMNVSFRRKASSGSGSALLLAKPSGEVWSAQEAFPLQIAGQSGNDVAYDPYIEFASDTLIKIQVDVSANNTEAFGGFQLYLVNN